MKFFVFDTETTNLIANSLRPLDKQPHIVEFYGCLVDDELSAILDEIEFICDPPVASEEKAVTIHKITDEMRKGKPQFGFYADDITAMIEKSKGVVGHNLSYDYSMVENEMKRLGRTISWPLRRICTVENTEHLTGKRLKLTELHQHLFGEGFPEAHRARNDVEATVRCFLELRKRGVL